MKIGKFLLAGLIAALSAVSIATVACTKQQTVTAVNTGVQVAVDIALSLIQSRAVLLVRPGVYCPPLLLAYRLP